MSLAFLFLELEYAKSKKKKNKKLDAIDLAKYLHVKFNEKVMSIGESVLFQYDDKEYIFTVLHAWVDEEETSNTVERVIFTSDTNIVFETASDSKIKIINQRKTRINSFLWKKGFSLQKYGIGGLGEEFTKIFKRAFASRIFPPHLINRLGIKHVKGMVLYGPPGTGKTLMARQIGKLLTGREPKIVSGPEVLNKYVGQSAKNVRDLFADAEREQREKGDQSDLHIIIFDEIDSISKPRGTENASSEKDSVVNQLLTKIDGVFALTNILVIGTTNRRDLLDEALLRPGRLEILVEFKLPDESGRLQILQIHTRKMKANSFLAEDVNLQEIALRTENYSGAELESIVKVAVAVALNRQITVDDRTKELNTVNIKVTMDDLLNGFQEIIPAFGASTTDLQRCRVKGMIDCSERHKHVYEKTMLLVRLVKSNICQLCTCLLEGPQGSGKTSIAATIGIDSDFPYIKIVSAASMEGLNENGRCAEIVKVFQDAYKFQWSIIILDNIERLLDYAAIGPWYSNLVAQTLWRRLESLPPEGKNVLVIGTTSEVEFLKSVKLCSAFSVTYHVPALAKADVIKLLGHLNVFANDDIDAAAEALDGMTLKKIYSVIDIATVGKKEGNLETILSRKEKIDINYFLDILSDYAFT